MNTPDSKILRNSPEHFQHLQYFHNQKHLEYPKDPEKAGWWEEQQIKHLTKLLYPPIS